MIVSRKVQGSSVLTLTYHTRKYCVFICLQLDYNGFTTEVTTVE